MNVFLSWGWMWAKKGEGDKKIQISSYKMSKTWDYNIQHGDYNL